MNTNRYGYAMSDEDDETADKPKKNQAEKKEESGSGYEFEGYEAEINTKVALMPKTTSKT